MTGNITFSVGMVSDIGARKNQQDAAIVSNNQEKSKVLAVLCDGMGGMNGGEIASNLALDTIYNDYCEVEEQGDIEDYNMFLVEELIKADGIVTDIKDGDGNRLNSGSTIVSLVIDRNSLFWASAGDSRLYIIRDNVIHQITTDHNYYMELLKKVEAGTMTKEEADSNSEKEALVSYLGMDGLRYIDSNKNPFEVQPDDVFIICSDGLYRVLTEEQINQIVDACGNDMVMAADCLVGEAVKAGGTGQDNTTVVAVKALTVD